MSHEFCFLGKAQDEEYWLIDDASELLHLQKVVRLKAGSKICLLDGHGQIAFGVLSEIANKKALVKIEKITTQIKPKERILVIAAIKSASFEESLPALCELGISSVHIYSQEGGAKQNMSEKSLGRWQKIIQESCKQSKRAHFLEVATWKNFAALVESCNLQTCSSFYTDLNGEAFSKSKIKESSSCLIYIGSEKGYSAQEYAYFKSKEIPALTISSYTLRAKTAMIAAGALICSI